MAVFGLLSGRGSPGVTTSALALALGWPLTPSNGGPARVMVVEADPVGSAVAAGYLAGRGGHRLGLASVLASREGELSQALTQNYVALEGDPDRWLVPGLSSPEQLRAARGSWRQLAATLRAASESATLDLLLDFGRWTTPDLVEELVDLVDLFVVVTRSDLLSLTGARHAVRAVQSSGGDRNVVCLMVGTDAPYRPSEVRTSLAVPVAATLAWDSRTALVFSHGEYLAKPLAKTALMRSAVTAAVSLRRHAEWTGPGGDRHE